MKAATLGCAVGVAALGMAPGLGLAGCDGHAPSPAAAPVLAASASAASASTSTAATATATALQGTASTAASDAEQAVLPSGQADRVAPPVVPPVVRADVSYAQADDGRAVGLAQASGVLVASDAASGKRLWVLAVYPAPVDERKEADAQWVFFKRMAFDPDGRLRIVNEAGQAFLVDVERRTVARAP